MFWVLVFCVCCSTKCCSFFGLGFVLCLRFVRSFWGFCESSLCLRLIGQDKFWWTNLGQANFLVWIQLGVLRPFIDCCFFDSPLGLRSSYRPVWAGNFRTPLSDRASREVCPFYLEQRTFWFGFRVLLCFGSALPLFPSLSLSLSLSLFLSWLDLQEQAACSLTTTRRCTPHPPTSL